MEELIYEDLSRKYFLLDYSPSHSELVIRGFNNEINNIDLFFKAVFKIDLNVKLDGIRITKIERTQKNKIENPVNRKYILKIADNDGSVGHIDAGLFVEFNNNLGMLETCLGDFTWTNENREVSSCQID